MEHEHSEDPEELVELVLLLSAALVGAVMDPLRINSDVSLHEERSVADLILGAVLCLHHRKVVVRIECQLNDGFLSEFEHIEFSFL